MSIPAIIGFISLLGIATRNGILLVSHYNHLRGEGMPLHESVVQGSLDRLNPILMTALSSALALIPLALGGNLPGNEIQSPMAKVILGGLLSSTLLNGFIIPSVYLIVNRKKQKAWNAYRSYCSSSYWLRRPRPSEASTRCSVRSKTRAASWKRNGN